MVEDTGIGIAAEHLGVIFQDFSQINHAIQRRVKGTGLGLSLSRKLAELLGGTLEAASRPGVGSTFTLTVPEKVSAQPTIDVESPRPPDYANATILVVDDDDSARYVCRQMFRGTDYRVIESSGMEAAERARFERPDLIILDLMMPGRTGFEVLEELKSDPATRETPVVIHTSKQITPADLARLSGRHVGILPKSGKNRKEALEAIRKALGNARLFAEEPEFVNTRGGIQE
jgi:CheY-like chemotaxis protein